MRETMKASSVQTLGSKPLIDDQETETSGITGTWSFTFQSGSPSTASITISQQNDPASDQVYLTFTTGTTNWQTASFNPTAVTTAMFTSSSAGVAYASLWGQLGSDEYLAIFFCPSPGANPTGSWMGCRSVANSASSQTTYDSPSYNQIYSNQSLFDSIDLITEVGGNPLTDSLGLQTNGTTLWGTSPNMALPTAFAGAGPNQGSTAYASLCPMGSTEVFALLIYTPSSTGSHIWGRPYEPSPTGIWLGTSSGGSSTVYQ